jgi:hypothetical protein
VHLGWSFCQDTLPVQMRFVGSTCAVCEASVRTQREGWSEESRVRCGAVRCGAVRCGAVLCGAVECGGAGGDRAGGPAGGPGGGRWRRRERREGGGRKGEGRVVRGGGGREREERAGRTCSSCGRDRHSRAAWGHFALPQAHLKIVFV